ncbi:acyl carrier protein familyprotein [Actinobacteria bacterium OK074]|nr:acyl carrier protein familyprotein [Actinobacteria bacterium OK074]
METGASPSPYNAALDGIRTGISRMKRVSGAAGAMTDDTPLWRTEGPERPGLSLDSLDFLELIVFLEEEYGWSVPESRMDLGECRTVGDLAKMVAESVADVGGPS